MATSPLRILTLIIVIFNTCTMNRGATEEKMIIKVETDKDTTERYFEVTMDKDFFRTCNDRCQNNSSTTSTQYPCTELPSENTCKKTFPTCNIKRKVCKLNCLNLTQDYNWMNITVCDSSTPDTTAPTTTTTTTTTPQPSTASKGAEVTSTSTPSRNSNKTADDGSGDNIKAIIGGVVAGVVVFAIIIVIVIVLYRRRHQQSNAPDNKTDSTNTYSNQSTGETSTDTPAYVNTNSIYSDANVATTPSAMLNKNSSNHDYVNLSPFQPSSRTLAQSISDKIRRKKKHRKGKGKTTKETQNVDGTETTVTGEGGANNDEEKNYVNMNYDNTPKAAASSKKDSCVYSLANDTVDRPQYSPLDKQTQYSHHYSPLTDGKASTLPSKSAATPPGPPLYSEVNESGCLPIDVGSDNHEYIDLVDEKVGKPVLANANSLNHYENIKNNE